MPLFFFLSGYFFSTKISFWPFFKKRFHTILKPYLLTILIIYVGMISFDNMRFMTAASRIIKSLYGTGYYIDWVQLWFLPSLFITSLFAYVFYRWFLARLSNRYLRWGILLLLQAVAVALLDKFYPFNITIINKEYELFGLPFSLDLVLLTGFFYMLGTEIRQVASDDFFTNKWTLIVTGSLLVVLTLIFDQRIDFNTRTFESFSVNTTQAVLGILFTLAVSKNIDLHTVRLASVLNYIGQASLFILIFHVPIQEYWGAKLYFVTNMPALSILSAFVISILISLGIYYLFFEQNPIALYWFGRRKALPNQPDSPSKD